MSRRAAALLAVLAARGASAATVRGTVRGEDGEPVPGAVVAAYDAVLDGVQATADEDGTFALEGLHAGTWRLWAIPPEGDDHAARFLPDATGFCDSRALRLAAGDAVEDADFSLPLGASLSGTLLGPDGAPVAGAALTASPVDAPGTVLARSATADEDGAFTVRGLDARAGVSESWVVSVEAEGRPEQYLGGAYDEADAAVFTVEPAGAAEAGTWTLLAGITVTGTVTGPDGPAADAAVYVYAEGQIAVVATDADGRYEATGLPPGDVLPWVSTPGLAMTYYPDADRPTTFLSAPEEGAVLEGADIEAPAEAVFEAWFVDPDTGEVLPGVSGLLYNDTFTVGRGAAAGEDGLLRIDRLSGGDYTLYAWGSESGHADDWVRGADGEPAVFTVEGEVDNAPVEIALPRAAWLAGEVVDEDGAPVVGATVTAVRADGAWEQARTDEDGAWEVFGVPAGDWAAWAGYDTWCPEDADFVDTWWGDEPNPDWAPRIALAEGEGVEDLRITVPGDDDHDGMADSWESERGLDPERDDAAEDPDEDGYTNLEEYLLDTDPLRAAALPEPCGARGAWLLFLGALPARRRRRRA